MFIVGLCPSSGLWRGAGFGGGFATAFTGTFTEGLAGLFALGLARGLARRAARGAWTGRLREAAAGFFARRCEVLLFLDFWRVFPATVFCVDLTSLARGCGHHPKNKAPGMGAVRVQGLCSFFIPIAHFWPESKSCGGATTGKLPPRGIKCRSFWRDWLTPLSRQRLD